MTTVNDVTGEQTIAATDPETGIQTVVNLDTGVTVTTDPANDLVTTFDPATGETTAVAVEGLTAAGDASVTVGHVTTDSYYDPETGAAGVSMEGHLLHGRVEGEVGLVGSGRLTVPRKPLWAR